MTATSHGFSKNSQILVYIMPVGNMSPRMYMEGVKMLQASSEIPMSSLTRPGGYSAELSPFRTLSWDSATSILYRFEDTMSAASSASTAIPCEDVHAWNRPLAVIGLCHCPSTANLRDAYADFKRAAANYPSAIVQKVYAFEHAFGAGTLEDVSALDDLVMFPLAAPLSDGHTTVSLHLQVVLDAMTVTILMSLESTVRGVLRQHQQQAGAAVSSTDLSESGFGLLSTQVDPPSLVGASSPQPPFLGSASNGSSTPALRTGSGNSTLLPRPSGVSNAASAMDLSGGTTLSRKTVRSSTRSRQEKLVADYALLVGCVSDAMEYYSTAIDGLRDEEKRAASTAARIPAGGDGLWLAAALEGYITALYLTMRRQKGGNGVKFNVELVEKASEAASWYAKVGCVDLEANLVVSMGWYYADLVDDPLSARRRRSDLPQRADEAEWVRRLCVESHQRLLSIPRTLDNASATVPPHRMIKHVLELARQGHRVGYTRKGLLYVLDASALLCQRGSRPPSASRLASSSLDLHAAYVLLEQVLRGLSSAPADHGRHPKDGERPVGWRRLRFYVLRQLIVLARKLRRPDAIATYALELLHLLVQSPIVTESADGIGGSIGWNDHVFTTIHQPRADDAGSKGRGQLHSAPTVYTTPPPSMEKDLKKAAAMLLQHHASTTSLLSSSYFKSLPLLAASNGATPSGSGGSTTPRTLLSTPRQLMSAVMTTNSSTPVATSTSPFFDASDEASSVVLADPPAPSPSTARPSSTDTKSTAVSSTLRRHDVVNLHARNHIQQWQHACWRLLHDDSAAAVPLSSSTSTIELPLSQDNGVVRCLHFGVSTAPATSLRRLDHVTQAMQRSKNNGQTASLPTNSTFFYNPFQAKDAKSDAANAPQTTFPLHATIALDLVVENPLEIDVHVPHVTAWIEEDAHDGKISKAQCVPVALKLLPRDRGVVVQLSVRPTQVGPLVVLGCLFRLKHQTLRYAAERPLVLEIVPPLPTLVLAPSPPSCSWSMFERQTKHVSVDVTNSTGLSASHMFMDLTVVVVKRAATKNSSTGCIPLVNSLQLDDTPPSLPHQLAVGGVDVTATVSPSLNHLERLAGRSSGTIDLFVTCLQPCTIELQLRALYCHTATHKQLYRETVASVSITCEPAVRLSSVVPLAATPSTDGRFDVTYAADLWNPSPSTPFVVQVPNNEAVDVPALCVRRVLLPAASLDAPFPWTTSSSSGNMAPAATASASSQLDSAGNAVPRRLFVALEGHPCALMMSSIKLHSFERLVVTMTPSSDEETPPAALTDVEIQLFEQEPTVAGALGPTDKLVVAGQLKFDPPPSVTEHAVHVMAVAHGVFHIRCVGKWKRPDDTWDDVQSPTLILQTV